MPNLTTTQDERTEAFTAFAMGYAEMTSNLSRVRQLLDMRLRIFELADPKEGVAEVLRWVDERNNDAANLLDQMQHAVESGTVDFEDHTRLISMAQAFGDENLGLALRFELESNPIGMSGCMNDTMGWALIHRVLMSNLRVDRAMLKNNLTFFFERMSPALRLKATGFDRLPLIEQ